MDQRLYDEDGNTVLHLATYTNQYQIIKVVLRDTNVNINAVNADGYNASAISEMNNINASSSEFDIRAQSLQRGGSSDQQAAGVIIITASNGRSNEEQQQQQIVDVDSSHGAGDHSSDKAKDDDKWEESVAGSMQNGILIVCSFFAALCVEAILNLPGGIEWEQLQSKPMNNITDGQLKKLQSFLISDVMCFFLSVTTIFLVTIASSCHYKYSLFLNSCMMGALVCAAAIFFYEVLVLATNDHLARVAFVRGIVGFFLAAVFIFFLQLSITKGFKSFIRKACSKIRDLITKL